MITETTVTLGAIGALILCIIICGISEARYFRGLYRRTREGYANLQEDIDKWTSSQ